MSNIVEQWFKKNLANPQVVVLVFFFLLIFGLILIAGEVIAPLLVAIVFAYLLEGIIGMSHNLGIPRKKAYIFVFLFFLLTLVSSLVYLIPLLIAQITAFINNIPNIFDKGQTVFYNWGLTYPNIIIDEEQIKAVIDSLRTDMTNFARDFLQKLATSVGKFITLIVYMVMVPMMVFFLLKDKAIILEWFTSLLPKKEDRRLSSEVWKEINTKIGNYIRGKMIEIIIVWVTCWMAFEFLGMDYAVLISFFVGLSVVIPYIGAAVVTIPVVLIAYTQWGISSQLAYVLIIYGIIQFLDANFVVPMLFAEVIKIHPLAIIVSVLVFGGIWGIWGAFFAIPLATVVNAVLHLWPSQDAEHAIPKL